MCLLENRFGESDEMCADLNTLCRVHSIVLLICGLFSDFAESINSLSVTTDSSDTDYHD